MRLELTSKNPVGFRLSIIDILVLGLAGFITFIYPSGFVSPEWLDLFIHWSIPFVVGNFFLFCNVFRVRTRYELLWCITAILNMCLFIYVYQNVGLYFLSQSVFTTVAIFFEIKSSKYHGIFAKVKS